MALPSSSWLAGANQPIATVWLAGSVTAAWLVGSGRKPRSKHCQRMQRADTWKALRCSRPIRPGGVQQVATNRWQPVHFASRVALSIRSRSVRYRRLKQPLSRRSWRGTFSIPGRRCGASRVLRNLPPTVLYKMFVRTPQQECEHIWWM